MSGSHSMVKCTKTTVTWLWRTLVKGMVPCSVQLTLLLVAEILILWMGLPLETGTFPMGLKFSAVISTEPEVTWWYVWTAGEVEWRGSTAVWYLTQWMLCTPYTLECTQQAVVSDIVCTLLFLTVAVLQVSILLKSEIHVKYTRNKPKITVQSSADD